MSKNVVIKKHRDIDVVRTMPWIIDVILGERASRHDFEKVKRCRKILSYRFDDDYARASEVSSYFGGKFVNKKR